MSGGSRSNLAGWSNVFGTKMHSWLGRIKQADQNNSSVSCVRGERRTREKGRGGGGIMVLFTVVKSITVSG